MKKILFLVTIIQIVLSSSLYAQSSGSAFGSLKFPVSSRVNAIGGENISIVTRDLSVTAHNPALLGAEMSNQVYLNYMHYGAGINLGGFLYSRAMNDRGAWSAGVQYTDYGTFQEATPDNVIVGSFGAKDININATLGYDINDRLRGGVKTKLLYSSYESYSSVALAVDLGLNYYHFDKDFSIGLTAKNLGGQLGSFHETRESLPFDLQIGVSKGFSHAPFRISITAVDLTNWKSNYVDNSDSDSVEGNKKNSFTKDLFRHFVFGAEYIPTDNLYIALGYNYRRRTDFSGGGGGFFTGFSAGTGLKIKMFDINLSIARYHIAGTSFMLGIALDLNKF